MATPDHVGFFVWIGHDVACRDAQDGHTLFFQPRISAFISLRDVARAVNIPVHFHRQMGRRTVEIEHIGPDRVLPSEARAVWAKGAQPEPKSTSGGVMDLRSRRASGIARRDLM